MNRRNIIMADINPDKISDIVDKINKFVEIYAKQKEFVWVYDTHFQNCYRRKGKNNVQNFTIKRFDFEREFYHNGLAPIYENSPFDDIDDKHKLSMYEVIQLHMEWFYPAYCRVNGFINKLLYYIPEKVTLDDFKEMNELYRNIQSEGSENMTDYIVKNGTPNIQI